MSIIKENTIAENSTANSLLRLISEYRSELMGAAVIWVMLLHGSELYPDVYIPIFTFIVNRGNIGVDIFLFLSGFGLFFSVSKNKNTIEFYRRRMNRVLIPYLILSLPFWVYNTVHCGAGVGKFLLDYTGISFVGEGVTTAWYVFLIIFLYLIYPFVFKLENQKGWLADAALIFLSILMCIVLSKTNADLYNNIEIAAARVPCFILGSMAARLYVKKMRIDFLFIAAYFFLSAIVFVLCAFVNSSNHELGVMMYRFGGISAALIVIAVICMFFKLTKKHSMVLKHFGAISLELYLIHIFLRYGLVNYHVGENMPAVVKCFIWLLTMALSVVLGSIFHYGYDRIQTKR